MHLPGKTYKQAWILKRIFSWSIWLMLTGKELKLMLNNFMKQQTKSVGISKDPGSTLFLWDYFQNSLFGYSWKINIQELGNLVVRHYKAKLCCERNTVLALAKNTEHGTWK